MTFAKHVTRRRPWTGVGGFSVQTSQTVVEQTERETRLILTTNVGGLPI